MLKVAPTKSVLFRLQEDLRFAREGHELLDRKREVLIMELMQLVHTIRDIQRRLAAELRQAYAALREAYLEMGSENIERANYAYLEPFEISVSEHSVMGVTLPVVRVTRMPRPVQVGLYDTSLAFEKATAAFAKVLPLLLEYTQASMTLTRLASEIQKTQRRVKALENVFIPDAEETIKFIREALEESEREDFFRRKHLKREQ